MPIDVANFAARNFGLGPDLAAIDQARGQNALLQNQVKQIPVANAMMAQELQNSQQQGQQQQIASDETRKQKARQVLGGAARVISTAQDPIMAVQQLTQSKDFLDASNVLGIPPERWAYQGPADPQKLREGARNIAEALLGRGEGFTLNAGDVRFDASGRQVAAAPAKPEPPEEQVAVIGRDGKPTYVRRSQSYGMTPVPPQPAPQQPDRELTAVVGPGGKPILVPRSQAAGMEPARPATPISPKDQNTARNKLLMLGTARKQLALVKEKFDALKSSFSAGPWYAGQGFYPTEAGKQFDKAVDSMRDIATGLTRVPGVGSMSDFETKLNQAKFPSRGDYESVTEQQIQSLTDMIDDWTRGYQEMLDDAGTPTDTPAPKLTAAQRAASLGL
jgi:hypothetical protein